MSKDTIYREDAIKVLYQCTPFDPNGIALLEKCEKEIRAIPSADRPQGEWLCSDNLYETAVCSNCGFDSGESYVVVKYGQKWKACPMCEARMKGADDADQR